MRQKTVKLSIAALLLVAIPATLTVYLLIITAKKYQHEHDLEVFENLLYGYETWSRAQKIDAIQALVAPSERIIQTIRDEDVCDTDGCLDQSLMLLKSINFSVDPCQDFYEFACGQWRKDNPLPDGIPFSVWSRWEQVSAREIILKAKLIRSRQRAAGIPAETKSKTVVKARKFYNSCMKADGCLKPLADILMDFGMPLLAPSWNAAQFNLSRSIGIVLRNFSLGTIIQSVVTEVSIESRIQLDVPLIDDSNETALNNPETEVLFQTVIKDMADAVGIELSDKDLQQDFAAIRDFEIELAEQFQPQSDASLEHSNETVTLESLKFRREEKNRELYADNEKRYKTTLGEYLSLTKPGTDAISPNIKIDLQVILEEQFRNTADKLELYDEILVSRDLNLTLLQQIIDDAGPRTVSNYLSWRLILHLLPYTTYATEDKDLQTLRTCTKPNSFPRNKRCLQIVFDKFEIALDYAILPHFVSPTKRSLAERIAGNVTKGFEEEIKGWDWMGRATKEKALEKVQGMIKNIGYSDDHLNLTVIEQLYAELSIQEDGRSYFDNLINIDSWQTAMDLKEAREVIEREAWLLLPTSSWAAHSYDQNSISISADLLAHPFLSETGLQSINYGSLGSLIGHEIGHGFDTTCGAFNSNGTKENWWEDKDRDAVYKIFACYVNQYNEYETEAGSVDGELTLDDNIADILGVEAALSGYEAWVKGQREPEPKLLGFQSYTPEQLFYLSFGNTWCSSETPEALQRILEDDHSPSRYRVIGSLQNSKRFADAWSCEPGTFMNPDRKCSKIISKTGTD